MSFTAVLFWINTLYHQYLEVNGYFLTENDNYEQKLFTSQMQVYLKY